MIFEKIDGYLYGKSNNYENRYKNIALFDLDTTLIKTKSNNTFSKTFDDFIILENVNERLSSLKRNIIIISNQGGIKDSDYKLNFFINKIELFEKNVNFEFEIYVAIYDNIYRKPYPTFYNLIKEKYKKFNSFYVGDACGRKNDFSFSDYYFFLNTNISNFYTPECYFKNQKNKIPNIKRKYKKYIYSYYTNEKYEFKKSDILDFVIMIGLPASGKSYISNIIKNSNDNFKILSYDKLTKAKFNKELKECIIKKNNIIIDNTNLTKDIRMKLINKYPLDEYNIRYIYFDRSIEMILHQNKIRYYKNYKNNKLIPNFVLKNMFKKLEIPKDEYDNIEIIDKYYQDEYYEIYLVDL